tara:strand:- start:60 stop:572 length:513 start_codon:yes stop_codon:yes gene_type:complete
MSFIISKEAFTQDELLEQLLMVISANNIEHDEDKIKAQSDKIALCVMLLLHNSEFDIKGHKPGYCVVTSENESISHNVKHVDKDRNEVDINESFGTLQVRGKVVLDKDGKDLTIAHPVMSSNLNAEDWCADELFSIEPFSDDIPNHLCKRLKFKKDLGVNEEFKLVGVGA